MYLHRMLSCMLVISATVPEFEHPALGHDADVRAVVRHVREDMAGNDQRFSLVAQIAEQLPELHTPCRVKTGRGFIEHDHRRVGQQRAGNADPLFHPPGSTI